MAQEQALVGIPWVGRSALLTQLLEGVTEWSVQESPELSKTTVHPLQLMAGEKGKRGSGFRRI